MLIQRCYLEITNICNLDCAFCAKTKRAKAVMSSEHFEQLTNKLQGKVKFLYFHLMGEPLLHPLLPEFVRSAREKGMVPIITTNGTLLQHADKVIEAKPYKIQISLHSHEGNLRKQTQEPGQEEASIAGYRLKNYMEQVCNFAKEAAQKGIIIILRLWNQGGQDSLNETIVKEIATKIAPKFWTQRKDGWKLSENLYLEYDQMFQWPELQEKQNTAKSNEKMFCYALRNQIGVLTDGSVVPCCLDHEGDITLGNLFESSLEEILSSPRATAIYDGFSQHRAVEDLCSACGYASVSKHFRNQA